MTLAKETEREKDAPKAREAIYLLLDLVGDEIIYYTDTERYYVKPVASVCSRITIFNL